MINFIYLGQPIRYILNTLNAHAIDQMKNISYIFLAFTHVVKVRYSDVLFIKSCHLDKLHFVGLWMRRDC